MTFTRAEKKTAKLRLALMGPSGSGKTYSALGIAQGLGKRIAVIDTQARQSEKYADLFAFDVDELTSFDPRHYVAKIREAEDAGYDVIIIDSLSHAWNGKGGILELVDEAAAAHYKDNKFSAWKDASPIHNGLIEAITRCKAHLIATMRTKTEYVLQTNEKGKQVPKKVGMAPVQRDGMEYEFDFVLDMDNALALVTTSRWKELTRATVKEPGADFGAKLMGWLQDGKEPVVSREKIGRLFAMLKPAGRTEADLRAYLKDRYGLESTKDIRQVDYDSLCRWVEGKYERAHGMEADPASAPVNPPAATAAAKPASAPAAAPKATLPHDDGHGIKPPAELKGKAPAAAKPTPAPETLTEADVLRLSAILQTYGKTKEAFLDHIGAVYGVEDAYGLRKADYDMAADWIIGRGEYAPVAGASTKREPGSDDAGIGEIAL